MAKKKPGGTKVDNALRKARKGIKTAAKKTAAAVKKAVKPVYKQTKSKDAFGRTVTTRRYKNPLTGRKRKVVKTQGGMKQVQVDRPQEGSLTKRRVVKQKTKGPTAKSKKVLKYNRKHMETSKTVDTFKGRRVKKKSYKGVPKTQRVGLKRKRIKK